jgi:hypothetical protein
LEKALAITIDQFLKHARFDIDDPVPGLFIQMNQIRHWGFFRHSTVDKLENRMKFPLPIARQLIDGARALEAFLANAIISYLYEV